MIPKLKGFRGVSSYRKKDLPSAAHLMENTLKVTEGIL